MLTYYGTFDCHRTAEPVNIAPPKAQGFTDSQPQTRAHDRECPNWFLQLDAQSSEFVQRETARLPDSLGCSLHLHEIQRITCQLENARPHRVVNENVQQVAHMRARLRRKV